MQSAAARTARGFASPPHRNLEAAPGPSRKRRRSRERNSHERGKATQGHVGLWRARRLYRGAARHRRPLHLEPHRHRRNAGRRRRARRLRLGHGYQHRRLLFLVLAAERLLLAAARPSSRVHPLWQVRGHRARRGLFLGKPEAPMYVNSLFSPEISARHRILPGTERSSGGRSRRSLPFGIRR